MQQTAKSEITWSLMHPTPLDAAYVRRVLQEARRYRVDGIEICGECHRAAGSLDGLVCYDGYRGVCDPRDPAGIERNRADLRAIVDDAHAAGKYVLYWHREVMVPETLASGVPELLDADGEFDLLGRAYEELLRYKIGRALEAVPDLDGVVLTLTESDYSVIHNSRPDRYPPAGVVAHLVRIFAGELKARGKRFVLRSFGSIAQDYEDLLAGAEQAARDYTFEVETKVTPYDFVPFLPVNPWLRRVPGATLGVECDCVGEFLGAGRLPAANVENIVRYVHAARDRGADRFTIRLDRMGTSIFDTSYEINLEAYHRAIDEPGIAAADVVDGFLDRQAKAARPPLRTLLAAGMEAIGKTNFIQGSVMFHTCPLNPSLKWVKAGGIFALFQPGRSLDPLSGIWSIRSEAATPADRDWIVEEKREARELAEAMCGTVVTLRGLVSAEWHERLNREWRQAADLARLYEAFCCTVCACVEGIETWDESGAAIDSALAGARAVCAEWLTEEELNVPFGGPSGAHTYGEIFGVRADRFRDNFALPVWCMLQALRAEYATEIALRRVWRGREDVADYLLFAAVTDEGRVSRYMHASHARHAEGRLLRQVGNTVFPNGFLEIELKRPSGPARLLIDALEDAEARMGITLDGGETRVLRLDREVQTIDLPPSDAGRIRVRLHKAGGRRFPEVQAAGVLIDS